MEKYKLNDRYVRDASIYILDYILSSNNIIIEDETRRKKMIRHIRKVIRAIKIDDLTKKNHEIRVGTVIHPCQEKRRSEIGDKPVNDSIINNLFPRILLNK